MIAARVLRTSLLLLVPALVLAWLTAGQALALEPLKQPEREALYQRVLSRPGASVLAEPDGGATVKDQPPPFAVYYVFERRTVEGTEWLNVGGPFAGPADGWVKAEETVDWHQQLLLAFNNPATRLRNLFFEERDKAVKFLEDERLPTLAEQTIRQADGSSLPADSPVVAIEPATFADINEDFYLLPILSTEDYLLGGAFEGKLVEVASIPLKPAEAPTAKLEDFNVAVVFVIDTTTSMEPYIERTRTAVEKIVEKIRGSAIGTRVSFGVVGFRDNAEAVPELEYTTKVFAEPVWPPDNEAFLEAMKQVAAASVSSQAFNEDGIAGMKAAIDLAAWDQFGGRVVVYISDAGVRRGKDPLSTTKLNPEEANQLAREKQIYTYSLLLKTPAGTPYHPEAELHHQALSMMESGQSLYFPIEGGDVAAFGEVVDAVAQSMVNLVEDSMGGRIAEVPAEGGDATAKSRMVGRAMQLAYLGRGGGAAAPDLFRGWSFDHAMDNPAAPSFEVRVLLNRRQISDLNDRLKAVLQAGQQSLTTGGSDFFQLLRTTMATFISDPARLAAADEVGDFLDEFLAALPYRSQVLSIDQDYWTAAGPSFQNEILAQIDSKIAAYSLIYNDIGRWTALYEGAPQDELVYPVPLSLLP